MFPVKFGNTDKGEEDNFCRCLGQECAWWDPAHNRCWTLAINQTLVAVGIFMGRIHNELCLSKYRYTCHYCQVVIEKTAAGETKEPTGWLKVEQVDGKYVWSCDRCQSQAGG
jgi:hypothetical protein